MALRTIRVQGDPVLEKTCKPVKEMTPKIRELIEDMLDTMYEANGVPAKPLLECAFAILICGDYSKAFKFSKDYFAVDGSIAGQNMILAAWSLGIGSVWLGTWPQMDRVFAQSKLFDLPNDQIPHSIIAFGYPLDEIKEKEEYYDESVVHYNKW